MTDRERLEENYEDALFAMWMDDFARERGQLLIEENERLLQDPSAAVPEEVNRKNLNAIHNAFRKKARHFTLKKAGRIFLRVAAVIGILAVLYGFAYAISPQVRVSTLNLLMQVDDQTAIFQLIPQESPIPDAPELMPTVTVGWLPEGYTGSYPVQDRLQTTIDCNNAEGDLIRVRVFADDQTLYNLDLEDADSREEKTIQGNSALLVEKDGLLRIGWADSYTGTYVYVSSRDVDLDTLIQVAESVSVSW